MTTTLKQVHEPTW